LPRHDIDAVGNIRRRHQRPLLVVSSERSRSASSWYGMHWVTRARARYIKGMHGRGYLIMGRIEVLQAGRAIVVGP
jgi:hypothetical protein